ncbi:MAG: outer membrane protein assembly factor BamB [Proteobacteria bacterium]|nr:outer membrane protein assembly factor BamB [Pseudomonadota bacterium]HQR04535.1 outer membrane protein assembly factor BamB [Rhodocyclaceae bacterium]
MKVRGLIAVLGLAIAACSPKYNPFVDEPDPRTLPAALVEINAPSAQPRLLWKESIGKAGSYVLTPAVVGDAAFAASTDGSLARFDGHGRQIWKISTGQTLSGGVGADGKLVVVGTAKGKVLAFDADTGAPRWQAQASSEILAAPVLGEGTVVVRSGDAHLLALDPADGKIRWSYERPTPALGLRNNAGVIIASGGVLAGFPGGKLAVISLANGALIWESAVTVPRGSTELERVADIASEPVLKDHQVCAVAYQGRVACFEQNNGSAQWSREVSSIHGLDMDARFVFVSEDKGAVQAFDRSTGSSTWRQVKLANRRISRPLAVNGFVVVGDFQGYVHVLRRDDGAFAARISTDGSPIIADPVAYGRGFLVQTSDGGLYAYTLD